MNAATHNFNPEIIATLIKAGADVKATDKNGQTVLDRMKKNLKLYKTDAYWEVNDKM